MQLKQPLLFLLLLSMACPAVAQKYYFRNYSRNEGLPQSTVFDIQQDKQGFIWFATDGGGVARFDGHTIESFSLREGLIDNVIFDIALDSEGDLWFAGEKRGVSRFDGRKFFRYDEKSGLTDTECTTLLSRKNGQVWVGTRSGKIFSMNHEGAKLITIADFPSKKGITDIIETSEEKILIATEDAGVYFIDDPASPRAKLMGLAQNIVWDLFVDSEKNIYAGTENGLYQFVNGSFLLIDEIEVLSIASIQSICEAQEGGLWIGTKKHGLFRWKNQQLKIYHEENGLPANNVHAVQLDQEGNLWTGMNRGGTAMFLGEKISIWDENSPMCGKVIRSISQQNDAFWFGTNENGACKWENGNFQTFSVMQGMPSQMVLAILHAPDGNTFFGTLGGVGVYDQKKVKILKVLDAEGKKTAGNYYVHDLSWSPNGNLIIATNRHGVVEVELDTKKMTGTIVQQWTTDEGLFRGPVHKALYGPEGKLWMAGQGGLACADNGAIQLLNRKLGLPDSRINTFQHDRQGNLWVGTNGGGLVFIPKANLDKSDNFTIIDSRNGLQDDNILSLEFDGNGRLWMATESTLEVLNVSRFRETSKIEIIHFDKHNGFTGQENSRNAMLRDLRGNIWVGTIQGAICFQPDIVEHHVQPPNIIIRDVQLFREAVDWPAFTDNINPHSGLPVMVTLPYDQNHVSFDFSGINFTNPFKVQYKHRLLGFDEEWSKESRVPSITYSNLPPGSYIFEVIASSQGTEWDREPAVFEFRIRPPWWQRWWFYLLAFVIVSGIVYGFFSYRIRSVRNFNEQLQVEIEQRKRTEIKLKETNKDLDTLLYRTAHDLKAPVATAIGMLEIAISDTDDEQMLQYLNMVKLSNGKLNLIVENLLEITHIKHKKLKPETCNIREMGTKIWASLDKEDDYQQVLFQNEVSGEHALTTDPATLRFILVNLFQNAIRYRNRAQEKSTLRLTCVQEGTRLKIAVSDNGMGIPAQKQSKIFDMFFRGTDVAEGTGLGLYVVRLGAERLGGSISVESKEKVGTTFYIRVGDMPAQDIDSSES